jgi:hypothetical protein
MMLVNNIVHDDGCFVFMCGLDYCFEQHCLEHKFKSYVRDLMIINEMFNNYEAQKDIAFAGLVLCGRGLKIHLVT